MDSFSITRIIFADFSTLSDSAVHALQFLDVINMKDPTQKSQSGARAGGRSYG